MLSIDEGNRSALKRLLDIQMRRVQHEGAAETAARLVRASTDKASRAEALGLLGHLERTRGNATAAVEAFEQALALVGVQGNVATEFRQMLQDQRRIAQDGGWQRYVGGLKRHLEQANPAPAAQAPIHLEIARVTGDELGNAAEAVAALQRGLAVAPDDVALRTDYATRLKKAGQLPQALQEYRRLLEVDVRRIETWRELIEGLKAMQRTAEATIALAPLVVLGAANDLERTTLSMRPTRTAAAHPNSFDDVAFRAIDTFPQGDPASELLVALSEVLEKLHPPELERYGLSRSDRISSRTPHPLRTLADRVALIFGVEQYDLYVHRAHSGTLEVEFTDPPAILVPNYLASLSESQQVFLLARPMANIARKLHAVDKLAPQAVEVLLAAAVRGVEPGFGSGLTDEEFLVQHSRRVAKAISRRGRRAIEDAASRYTSLPRIDFVDWVAKAKLTAARAGLIVADDLVGSIELVRRLEGDLAGLQGVMLAQGIRAVHDLLRFWVSDAAFALRRRLGMM